MDETIPNLVALKQNHASVVIAFSFESYGSMILLHSHDYSLPFILDINPIAIK